MRFSTLIYSCSTIPLRSLMLLFVDDSTFMEKEVMITNSIEDFRSIINVSFSAYSFKFPFPQYHTCFLFRRFVQTMYCKLLLLCHWYCRNPFLQCTVIWDCKCLTIFIHMVWWIRKKSKRYKRNLKLLKGHSHENFFEIIALNYSLKLNQNQGPLTYLNFLL
jgi:hypothetical protein